MTKHQKTFEKAFKLSWELLSKLICVWDACAREASFIKLLKKGFFKHWYKLACAIFPCIICAVYHLMWSTNLEFFKSDFIFYYYSFNTRLKSHTQQRITEWDCYKSIKEEKEVHIKRICKIYIGWPSTLRG